MRSNAEKLLRARHVDAGRDLELFVRDAEIQDRSGRLSGQTVAWEMGRYVSFIRRLVLTKPSVAVNPKNRLLGIGGRVRAGKPIHLVRKRRYQRDHGVLQFTVEDGLARLEPLAPIISLE